MDSIKICVGSLNPTKINAVKIGFNTYYKNFKLYKIKVDSKVPKQPIGLKIILKGAENRAEIFGNQKNNRRGCGEICEGEQGLQQTSPRR